MPSQRGRIEEGRSETSHWVPQNLMPKPCVKALWQSLIARRIGGYPQILCRSLMSKPCVEALCQSLVSKPCVKALWQSLVSKPCGKTRRWVPQHHIPRIHVKALCQNIVTKNLWREMSLGYRRIFTGPRQLPSACSEMAAKKSERKKVWRSAREHEAIRPR